MQSRHVDGWFPSPYKIDVPEPVDLVAIIAYIKGMAGYVSTVPLRRGDRGRGGFVNILQVRLEELGYNPGTPDGIFGRKTEKAVKNLQRVSGLVQDGVVGGETWKALWP
jgi:peptidoglycan hydrolase-like protein with peptidoglycan-binding domain